MTRKASELMPPEKADAPRILVVGPSWVGDMIMAQSLFMDLKTQHPNCTISVLAPTWTEPLLQRMPEVTLSIPAPFKHGSVDFAERRRVARVLRGHGFNQAIVLPGSLKSALAPWLAGIPQRTGFRGEMRYGLLNDIRPLDKSALTMTVQRFVALGKPEAIHRAPDIMPPMLSVSAEQVEGAKQAYSIPSDTGPVLGLCPGAEYGSSKRWPIRHYAELGSRAQQMGYQVWLFGSENDRDVCGQIAEGMERSCIDLSGRTSLGKAIDLMSCCDRVVSNDSGLMHVAAALGRPVISLYGSSSPDFTPPLSDCATILNLQLACSPCFKRECPLGHHDCLEKLSPERVLSYL